MKKFLTQSSQRRRVVVCKHSVLLSREDSHEDTEKGKELLFARFSLNKMNLESTTIILRTTTLSSPSASSAPLREEFLQFLIDIFNREHGLVPGKHRVREYALGFLEKLLQVELGIARAIVDERQLFDAV